MWRYFQLLLFGNDLLVRLVRFMLVWMSVNWLFTTCSWCLMVSVQLVGLQVADLWVAASPHCIGLIARFACLHFDPYSLMCICVSWMFWVQLCLVTCMCMRQLNWWYFGLLLFCSSLWLTRLCGYWMLAEMTTWIYVYSDFGLSICTPTDLATDLPLSIDAGLV